MTTERYEHPELTDYGTLTALTRAITVIGAEDGASKNDVDQHHSLTIIP